MAKQQQPQPGQDLSLLERSIEFAAQQVELTRNLSAELNDILGIRQKINSGEKAALDVFRELNRSASQNYELLRKEGKLRDEIYKDKRNQLNIEREIKTIQLSNFDVARKYKDNAKALADASNKQNEALIKVRQQTEALNKAQASYAAKNTKANKDALALATKNKLAAEDALSTAEEHLKVTNEQLTVDEKLYGLYIQAGRIAENIKKTKEEELRLSFEINRNMGVAGALLDNLDKVGGRFFGGLGLNFGIFQESLHDAKESMDDVATSYAKIQDNAKKLNALTAEDVEQREKLLEETKKYASILVQHTNLAKDYNDLQKEIVELQEKGENISENELALLKQKLETQDNILKTVTKQAEHAGITKKTLESIKATFPGIRKGFLDLSKDAFSIGSILGIIIPKLIGGLINAINKVDQPLTDMARNLGMSRQEAIALRKQFNEVALTGNNIYVTGQKLSETFSRLSQKYGFTVTENTKLDKGLTKNLETMTAMTEQGKFSAEAADAYYELATLSGKPVSKLLESTGKIVVSSTLQNKMAINTRQVMEGVAKASSNMRLHMTKSPEGLVRASAAALALGTDLQKLENIASGMLDFEQSISAEMEAQLITGKEFSLAGLRYASAFGTAEDQARELGKVMTDMNLTADEWSNMNAFARESAAKALNLSQEELASMIARRDVLKTTSQAAYNDYKAKWDNLVKTKSVEEALAEMGENEITRQFATTSNAEKLEAVKLRLANLLETVILPISENIATVFTSVANTISKITTPVFKFLDRLGLTESVKTQVLTIAAVAGLVMMVKTLFAASARQTALMAQQAMKGTIAMPMIVTTVGGAGGVLGKAGGVLGKAGGALGRAGVGMGAGMMMGRLAAAGAVAGTVSGLLTSTEGKTSGVGDFFEKFGGVGLDALSWATGGIAGEALKAAGAIIPGMTGTQSAIARSIYKNKFGSYPSNQQLIADIKGSKDSYPSDIVNVAASMAKGGIVDKATVALIGEGTEPEAVIPLSKLGSMLSGTTGGILQSGPTTEYLKQLVILTKEGVGDGKKLVNETKTLVKSTASGLMGSGTLLDKAGRVSQLAGGRGGSVLNAASFLKGKVSPYLDQEKAQVVRSMFQKAKFGGSKEGRGFADVLGSDQMMELIGASGSNFVTSKAAGLGSRAGGALGGLAGKGLSKILGEDLGQMAGQGIGKFASKQLSKGAGKLATKALGKTALSGLGGGGGALAGLAGAALPIAGIAAGAAGLFFGGRALIRKRKAARDRERQRAQKALYPNGIPSKEEKEALARNFTKLDEVRASGKKISKKRRALKIAAAGMFGVAGIAGGALLGKRRKKGLGVSPEIPETGEMIDSTMEVPTDSLDQTIQGMQAPGMLAGGPAPAMAPAGGAGTDVISKLEELINVVKGGTGVYLNGNKVGEALVLSATSTS